jgi:gamma-glutamyltranspeptidase/glutathione hydrolase
LLTLPSGSFNITSRKDGVDIARIAAFPRMRRWFLYAYIAAQCICAATKTVQMQGQWHESDFRHFSLLTKNLSRSVEYYERLGFNTEHNKHRPSMGFKGAWLQLPITTQHSIELHLIQTMHDHTNVGAAYEQRGEDKIGYKNVHMVEDIFTKEVGYPHFTIEIMSDLNHFIDQYRASFKNCTWNFHNTKQKLVLGGVRPVDRNLQIFLHDPDGNAMEVTASNKPDAHKVATRSNRIVAESKKAIETPLLQNELNRTPAEVSKFVNEEGHRSVATGQNVLAVSFGNPTATRIALRVLKRGGSAADAVIAANVVLAVLEPMNCGVGGDFMSIIYEPPLPSSDPSKPHKKGKLIGLNGSGPVGAGVDNAAVLKVIKGTKYVEKQPEAARQHPIPLAGAAAATTVPGAVAAWCALHERYGKLPWKDLFLPAISMAMQGFNISLHAWRNWNSVQRATQAMQSGMLTPQQYVDFMSVYAPGGTAPLPGEFMRNPALGRTLFAIADGGCDEFYAGATAEEFGGYLKSVGALLTAQDLKDFWKHGGAQWSDVRERKGIKVGSEDIGKLVTKGPAEWSQPLCTTYRDKYHVHGMSGNSQALAGLQMLSVLDEYDPAHLRANPLHRTYLLVALKRIVYIYDRAVYAGDGPRNASAMGEGCEARGASLRRVLGLSPAEIKSLIDESFQAGKPFPIDKVLEKVAALHPDLLKKTTKASQSSVRAQELRRLLKDELPDRAGDTLGFVVRDASGLIISGLQSNAHPFGSLIVSPDLGFVLHNRGSKFNLLDPDQHPNALKPGRRVLHTLSPWVVTHADSGLPFLAVAMKGGDRQPYAFVQVLSNFVDLQMSLPDAIAAPRFRHGAVNDASAFQPLTTFTTALLRRDSHDAVVTSSVNTTIEIERGYALSAFDWVALQSKHGIAIKVHPVDAPFEDSAFGVCQVLHHSYPTRDKFPSRSLQAGAVVVSVEAVTDALRKPGLAVSVAVAPLKTVQPPATPKN